METTQRMIESRVLGETITFVRTAEETDGALLEMEACYAPGQRWEEGVPHYHPHQDERFEVLTGILTVEIDGSKRSYVAGEQFEILRGTVHTMRNLGSIPVRVRWEVRPALRTEEFFVTAFAAVDEGILAEPEHFGALLERYGDVFRVAGTPEA